MRSTLHPYISRLVTFTLFMGYKLFGISFSAGYQAYLSRLNEAIHSSLNKDAEGTFDAIKAQTLGALFTAYSLLPKVFGALNQPTPAIVTYSGAYFLTGLLKKMFEKISCEEVQMIDRQTIGLIRGKCLVCKLDFINMSFTTQAEYSNPMDMLRKSFNILIGSIEADPFSEPSKYVLTCIKEILEKVKQTMLLDDFMEFDAVSKLVSTLMDLLSKFYMRAEHKEYRKLIIESIGNCYFEDENDNYLVMIKSLADKLLTVDERSLSLNSEDTILRLFADISGMMLAVNSTKVAIAVIRIW